MADPQNKAEKTPAEAALPVIQVYAKEIETIIKTTRKRFGKSPDFGCAPGAPTARFFQYWRFALAAAAAAIDVGLIGVPDYSVDMPFKNLHINFSTASASHEDCADDPSISLTIPECVSKGDIIRAVSNYLYGEDITPLIHTSRDENGLTWGNYLPYNWAWRAEKGSGVPVFDIYCCLPEDFEECSEEYSSLSEPSSPQNGKEVK